MSNSNQQPSETSIQSHQIGWPKKFFDGNHMEKYGYGQEHVKYAPTGFSWAVLFLLYFGPLLRRDFVGFFALLGSYILVAFVLTKLDEIANMGGYFILLYLPFWVTSAYWYNTLYRLYLSREGYVEIPKISK